MGVEPARAHARPILFDDHVEQPARKHVQAPDRPAHEHDAAVGDAGERADRRDPAEVVVPTRQAHQQIARGDDSAFREPRRGHRPGPAKRRDRRVYPGIGRRLNACR
jgi:hypothetical protein